MRWLEQILTAILKFFGAYYKDASEEKRKAKDADPVPASLRSRFNKRVRDFINRE